MRFNRKLRFHQLRIGRVFKVCSWGQFRRVKISPTKGRYINASYGDFTMNPLEYVWVRY